MLKYLLERGEDCPKVVATTHFHDVFHGDLLSPYKLPITFVHMQVLLAFETDPTRELVAGGVADDEDEDGASPLTSGDKITKLYKCARLISCFRSH